MTKQCITGADAIRAIADGRKVRDVLDGKEYRLFELINGYGRVLGSVDRRFEIVEEPATDAELIAEFRRLADKECWNSPTARHFVNRCADMLEKRKTRLP
jgi:hypothetical protein